MEVTCVFGPINRGPIGPNGRFPGNFLPKGGLLGCLRSLKKFLVKTRDTIFLWDFQFLPVLRPTRGSRAQPAPKTAQKNPKEGQKRVLVITLARGGVTGWTTPLFPCTMRVSGRFRRVRDPNGTIWTTFGLPAGPAGSEKIFGRGSRGSRKKNFLKNFFCSKTIFIGP